MRITLLLAIAAVLGAAQDMGERGSHSGSTLPASRPPGALQARPVDTPATEVCVGDVAPDVSFQGVDARWRRLRDLAADHPLLLVFGANETTLRVLEAEREGLLDHGVLPVAVLHSRLGTIRTTAQRLELRYTLLADPQGVIASQFNAVDPATGGQLPAWFVLDPTRRVRALGRAGLPSHGYTELVAEALGLPPPAANVPAAR